VIDGLSRDSRIAWAVFALAFLLFNANLRAIGTGDSYPARFIPFAVWSRGTLALDSLAAEVRMTHPDPYWVMTSRQGSLISAYPVVTPLLVTPLYYPVVKLLDARGWTYERVQRWAEVMEKLAASLVTSAAMALFYLLVRRRAPRSDALLLTTALAAGTSTWVICSQALWQHGPAQLLLIVAILVLAGERLNVASLAVAGIACGLMAVNRPPNAIFAVALSLHVLIQERWRAGPFLLAAAGAALPFVAYNIWTTGHLLGGYAILVAGAPGFFSTPLHAGVAGLLVSPGKGLFVYSPFLLFLLIRPIRILADLRLRRLTLVLGVAVALQLAVFGSTDIRGGHGYGTRYLADMLPILVFCLVPVVRSLKPLGRATFVGLLIVAVVVQFIGAFRYPTGQSDFWLYAPPPTGATPTRTVWSVKNSPILREANAKWATMTFRPYLTLPAHWK
jgi:hypothetical protein